jgi:WD40 repeat protein
VATPTRAATSTDPTDAPIVIASEPITTQAPTFTPRAGIPAGWQDQIGDPPTFRIAVPSGFIGNGGSDVVVATSEGLAGQFKEDFGADAADCGPEIDVLAPPFGAGVQPQSEAELMTWATNVEKADLYAGQTLQGPTPITISHVNAVAFLLTQPADAMHNYTTHSYQAFFASQDGVWAVDSWACGDAAWSDLKSTFMQVPEYFETLSGFVMPGSAASTSTNSSSLTGSMATARANAATARLQNGLILVAGGLDANHPLASAEIYDAATGKFSRTGSMAVPRGYPTATLLPDGRVLVVGGWNGSALATAELFDPATGKFSPTGSMITARYMQTATLLSDGRVLLVGGNNGSAATPTSELYDPTTGKFSPTGSMTSARVEHTATLLSDGRVLVAGGCEVAAPCSQSATAEIYDPTTGKFTATGSMTQARDAHTATLLKDGRVLIAGGYTSDINSYGALDEAEVYDPATGSFSVTGSMTVSRDSQSATMLPDGRVLIVSGLGLNSGSLASVEVYDPGTGNFRTSTFLWVPRAGSSVVLLSDGRVLIAGGFDGTTEIATAELLRP